jgi:enoyl-[acyl-carrier protein] reductase II
MGTRMLATEEASVHQNFKDAIVSATDDGTVLISVPGNPTMRVLRNTITEAGEHASLLGNITDLYFGGDMEASVANTGQVSSRIDQVRPVADLIKEMWEGCNQALDAGRARLG